MDRRRFGMNDRLIEALVFLARHRAVQVVALAVVDTASRTRLGAANVSVPSRRPEHLLAIDRFRENDGADRVVEVQVLLPDQLPEIRGQRVGGQRSRCQNHRLPLARRGNRRHLVADDGDERMPRERVGDRLREPLAIDGQRGARRHARLLGGSHHERTEPAHLLFQQADGVIEFVPSEGVAADELSEGVGLVDGGLANRPHLMKRDRETVRSRLPGGFRTGEPAADDGDHAAVSGSASERE